MKNIIQAKSKNEQVYEFLHSQIVSCNIAPGSRLVIDHLAKNLGVSQIPIREAITRLEAEGFVTIEPHVGVTVTPLQAKDIREVFEVLEAMEIISGRTACEQMDDSEIAWLEQLVTDMEEMVHDPELWSLHNKEFHYFICEKSNLKLVGQILGQALDHWDRLRHYYLTEVSARRVSYAQIEHSALLKTLKARNADVVAQVIREHNRAALAAYLNHLGSKE